MSKAAFDLLARPIQQILWDLKWTKLRPIQVTAIQEIQSTDRDVIITARTAAGKTEAAFLPILSQLHASPPTSVGAIYVGPLKALINDQFQRLDRLCERAVIAVHRWHGDVDQSRKARLLANPSGVLLITPESLESLFVNRSSAIPRLFRQLRFVVIDEVHSLLGCERGTQLRNLLFRLQDRIGHDFRIVALSATIGEHVEAYAHWMRPDDTGRVAHLSDPGERKRVQFGIRAYHRDETPVDSDMATQEAAEKDQETPEALVDEIAKSFCGRKNLIFCNRREDVEWLADRLNEHCLAHGRPPEFLVHHGALSREIREFTEQQMRESRPATTICSSTLELGIDIGNVAAVGQLGPPWSVNSQVQRLGRSGRRDDEPHVMQVMLVERPLAASDKMVDRMYPRLLHAIAVTELMKQKWVEPPRVMEFDFSTLVQQILSVLAESGGCRANRMFQLLAREGAFRSIDQHTFANLLRSLGRRELLEQTPEGDLILAPAGERIVHDRDFYSAFATDIELSVTFDGRPIGMLPAMFISNLGDHVILAARRWQVLAIDERRREIQVRPARGRKPPRFTGRGGEIHPRVRQEMLEVLTSDQEYAYLNPVAAKLLDDAREVARQVGLLKSPVVALGPSSCLWFTWTGTRIQETLCLAAKQAGLEAADEDVAIEFKHTPGEVCERLRSLCSEPLDAVQLARAAPLTTRRKFDEYVDEELLTHGFASDGLDAPGAERAMAGLLGASQPNVVDGRTPSANFDFRVISADDVRGKSASASEFVANMPLSEMEFVALDVETTGFVPVIDHIVEMAAVRFRMDGTVLEQWQTLVDPGRAIPSQATAVHGITDEIVRGQPPVSQAAAEFTEFLSGSTAVVIAHNAPFDLGFVSAACLMHRLPLPDVAALCTLELARARLQGVGNHRLETLAAHFRLANRAHHRAGDDAALLSSVFRKLIRLAPAIDTAGELQTVLEPLTWQDGNVFAIPNSARVATLISAIEQQHRVSILYERADGQLSDISVTPMALIHSLGCEYLVALCHHSATQKTYRLDRVRRVRS